MWKGHNITDLKITCLHSITKTLPHVELYSFKQARARKGHLNRTNTRRRRSLVQHAIIIAKDNAIREREREREREKREKERERERERERARERERECVYA
jgi:hypothetical protein